MDEMEGQKIHFLKKQEIKRCIYSLLLSNNLYHHESCEVLEELLKDFKILNKRYKPSWKTRILKLFKRKAK